MERESQPLINIIPAFKNNDSHQQPSNPEASSLVNKYIQPNKLILITLLPPVILLLVYSILGGLALFMYLMGMSTVIGVELWFFQLYFNQDQQEEPTSNKSSFLEETKDEGHLSIPSIKMKSGKLQIQSNKTYESDANLKKWSLPAQILQKKNSSTLIMPFDNESDERISLKATKKRESFNKRTEPIPQNDQRMNLDCSAGELNEEGVKLLKELQSNPLSNQSPPRFKKEMGRDSASDQISMIHQRKNPQCQCKLEKDNFKIIIRAKSTRIVGFLNLLEGFYTDLMQTEQACGKNLSKLGLSKLFHFNESILFKDAFDDPTFLSQSKVAMKLQFTFCKWKMVRNVFNETGLSHVDSALFFKQGVLAQITALSETVQNTVRTLQQKHIVMCEKLQQSEKNLMKVKDEYSKAYKCVEEAISNYTKAQQNIKDYQKILELEMKYKLAYKKLEDWVSKVSDSSDSMFEARESFNVETLKMIDEMKGMDRNKVEVFKSSLMSFIENQKEFEVQIQLLIDECSKHSNQSKASIQSNGGLLKFESESSPGGRNDPEEDETMILNIIERKRSLKFNIEEVKTFMNEVQDEDDMGFPSSGMNSELFSYKSQKDSIGPKKELLSIRNQLVGDDDFDPVQENSSDEEENAFASPVRNEFKFSQLSFSPGQNMKSSESQSRGASKEFEEEKKREVVEGFTFSQVDTLPAERNFNINCRKVEEEGKQTQMLIQGMKDLSQFFKQMKEVAAKYHHNHTITVEKQYEEQKFIPGFEQEINQGKVLKLSREHNEKVANIWSHFIANFKSYLHQYEVLAGKLGENQQSIELFLKKQSEKKEKILTNFKLKGDKLKKSFSHIQKNIAQLKYIEHQQLLQGSPKRSTQLGDIHDPNTIHVRPHSQQNADVVQAQSQSYFQNYNQYYKQMQNIQLIFKNPSPLIMAYKGNLPSEDQCKLNVKKAFSEMLEIEKQFNQEFQICIKELQQVRNLLQDKVATVKSDLMMAHYERAKNSQSFFKTFIQCVEGSLNDIQESTPLGDIESQDDMDMIIANENQRSDLRQGHKPGCIYYEEGNQIADGNHLMVRTSPHKISSLNRPHQLNKLALLEEEKEENLGLAQVDNRLDGGQQRQTRTRANSFQAVSPSQKNKMSPDKLQESLQNMNAFCNINDINFGGQVNVFNTIQQCQAHPSFQPEFAQQQSNSHLLQDCPHWFNRAFNVFYEEWKTSQVFQNFIRKELYISSNKGRSSMLEEIDILEVKLFGRAPEFLRVQVLDSAPEDSLFDIDLSYRGTLEVLASTQINLNFRNVSYFKLPLTIKIIVRSLNGKVRVFYSNDKQKGCWYGFVGKPVIKLNVEPVIGKDNKFPMKQIPIAISIIEDLFQKKLYKYCLPNKRPIGVPVTKQSGVVYPKPKESALEPLNQAGERRANSGNRLSSGSQLLMRKQQ